MPRRETYTAKKLDEIRGEAEAELGMVSSKIMSAPLCHLAMCSVCLAFTTPVHQAGLGPCCFLLHG